MTRDEFRNAVFERDGFKCVVCSKPAQDAHHIIERRLWGDSCGYFLDNGASLCGEHHIQAEQTLLSCDEIRIAAKIEKVILPEHFYDDVDYDKWGNIILSSGKRVKGELFFDESVQKILKSGDVLELFLPYVKYPRTYHLPWSEGLTKDDRQLKDVGCFDGKEVVVTVKCDGENYSLYADGYVHARSLDSKNHPSRNYIKSLWGKTFYELPKEWRVCGENLYAKHSIKYENLDDYLLVFSIWNDRNYCLSWDDMVEWCSMLGLHHVPVVYRGVWNEAEIRSLWEEIKNGYNGEKVVEGYVVRLVDSFYYGDFRKSAAKFVRKDHVQTHGFWMRSKLEPNGLKDKE